MNRTGSSRRGSGIFLLIFGMLLLSISHFVIQTRALTQLLRQQREVWTSIRKADLAEPHAPARETASASRPLLGGKP